MKLVIVTAKGLEQLYCAPRASFWAADPAAQRALEAQDREGYLKKPQSPAESRAWEAEQAWPEE